MLQILTGADLQHLNTLAVPATADYFAGIHSVEDLLAALEWNKEKRLPLLLLGGGSNLILRQRFPGLVLHIRLPGIEVTAENESHVWLRAGAGENWHNLVRHCLRARYWGLENLSLIPGSVGAAPVQNIGAYGVELQDVFAELQAIDIHSGEQVTFDKEACHFEYRESVFKQHLRDRYVITSVTLRLLKQPQPNFNYPALRDALTASGEQPSPQLIGELVCNIRRAKLPAPEVVPNAGSFFKNPVVDVSTYQRLCGQYPEMVAFAVDQTRVKLAAGWLIDRAGWRGYCDQGVAVHDHQALVLVNPGRCQGACVLALAERIRASVQARFGVNLELEPRVYGTDG